jgi:two-component system cell cycle response regulator DivK
MCLPETSYCTKENRMTHILLVEDNEMNRDMLTRRLRRKGFEVATANDGVEGVARTRSSKPDLILLDMSLPLKDGWTVATELKADRETSMIPIIALTAHAMEGDRDKALAAGCDEYETKPVEFARLLEKIRQFLPATD